MQNTFVAELSPVARTLFVPLACRAIESARPDGILHDPHAESIYSALGSDPSFLMGMDRMDRLMMAIRASRFDAFARASLQQHPDGLLVELGCGLDTRADRLADLDPTWVGIDLPEVILLRRKYIPDSDKARCIPRSMLDLSWIDEIAAYGKPVIFLAEGVFPYFSTAEVRPMVTEMAKRFPQGELVFEAAAGFINRHHNRTSSVLKKSGTTIRWDAEDGRDLQQWGLCLLKAWSYFDTTDKRLRFYRWMRFIPGMADATGVFHYRLS